MENMREFTELLKGCRPVKDSDGNILVQSIMNMQIVCLTTDPEYSLDERFENPMKALYASNSTYGHLHFDNKTEKEVIIPAQMAVVTKQRAQNHTMIKGGYIDRHDDADYNDAGCVQGSQTGHIHNSNEYRMIPVTIREMLFDTVGKGSDYSRVYPAIRALGRQTQSNTQEYLDRYFNKYDEKLEQFIAHFERPKNFIGVIVLVDGEIVAIDKFPSFTYAEQLWDALIRDCYGALAIVSELKERTSNNVFTETLEEVQKNNTGDPVELLEKALTKTKEKITSDVREKIEELLAFEFEATLDTEGNPNLPNKPKSFILKNEGYVGQVITENEFNHLVSIVKRDKFDPNAYRQVSALRQKARKQDRFSL